jgi:hypothetical protein
MLQGLHHINIKKAELTKYIPGSPHFGKGF